MPQLSCYYTNYIQQDLQNNPVREWLMSLAPNGETETKGYPVAKATQLVLKRKGSV